MRIEEIMDDTQATTVHKSAMDALVRQTEQIKVKKAKLAAANAKQRASEAQGRLRKVQLKSVNGNS